ncbi:hypothetical protein ACQEU8_02405 [Streptomyces sp. CA-250714]|uniref:hypothetical protein n=1 Tax=Streptomyces sp. CA-250714 TaxID=3240060 RepID=UPI003D9134DB
MGHKMDCGTGRTAKAAERVVRASEGLNRRLSDNECTCEARKGQAANRRERYAAAIDDTFVYSTDFDAEKAADAAMVIADEELQRERERLFVPLHRAESENARLRAERDTFKAQVYRENDECARLRLALSRIRGNINNSGCGGAPELIWSIVDILNTAGVPKHGK